MFVCADASHYPCNIDVADSEPESGEFKPDIPQNAVQKGQTGEKSKIIPQIPARSSNKTESDIGMFKITS